MDIMVTENVTNGWMVAQQTDKHRSENGLNMY